MDTVDQIIATLNHIESVEDDGDFVRLENALQALSHMSHPEQALDALFRLYERFPESDGYGLFWSILHRLEEMPGFEHQLIESVQRQPMAFNLHMVNGLLNAGIAQVAGVNLLALLEQIATHCEHPAAVRHQARHLIAWQRNHA